MKEGSNEFSLTEKRFGFFIVLMRFGTTPIFIKKRTISYGIYDVVSTAFAYALPIVTAMDLIMNKEGMRHFMETFRAFIIITMALWQHVNLRLKRTSLEEIFQLSEEFTWEELPPRHSETGYVTNAGILSSMPRLLKYALALIVVPHVLQSTGRMIFRHAIVVNSWYPFDITTSPAYEIVNFSQMLGSVLCQIAFYSYLGVIATFILIACTQLEKLRMSLSAINQTDDMQKQLSQCIRHHQKIIKFVRSIEDSFNIAIGGTLLFILISLCSVAFSAILSWNSPEELLQILLILVSLVLQLWILCTLGEELTQQGMNVSLAAYSSDWVGAPIPFQRSILFIITTSKHGLKLTGGKLISVSKESMETILRQTLSYFMFLLQVKDRNEVLAQEYGLS